MKRIALIAVLAVTPVLSAAQTSEPITMQAVDQHILPRFDALAVQSQALSESAAQDCDPTSATLRSAFGRAFDAWISASHLRFGPSEIDDRAFALAFWPDTRSVTPKTLSSLLTHSDPIATSVQGYAEVSIAARGFYALEFLLYDTALSAAGSAEYRCTLIQTIAADAAKTSASIARDWTAGYAVSLKTPSESSPYRSELEALQELFKALSTGLQFTSDTRLGRPLGTFDRPRPARAEARRSGRSARHVVLSLGALSNLAMILSQGDAALQSDFEFAFAQASAQIDALNDPTFAGVAEVQERFTLEIAQQSIDAIRIMVRDRLGPKLGVAAGFNALDGD